MSNPTALVQKLWNYCNILRDDGLSYGDYASAALSTSSEQLTFLLFLKMADERNSPPWKTARKGAKYSDLLM
jgi:type I restriction enzyme M protein